MSPHGGPERFDILAESGLLDDRTLVLMRDHTFLVVDRQANALPHAASRHGLYHDGTRFLSGLLVRIHGRRPLLLSSGVREDNGALFAHETNPDVREGETLMLARDTVHLRRRVVLVDGACEIELRLRSYGDEPIVCPLDLRFAADFADVFEVRGARREKRGEPVPIASSASQLAFGYFGCDGRLRATRIDLDGACEVSPPAARYQIELPPGGERTISLRIECTAGSAAEAGAHPPAPRLESRAPAAVVTSSSRGFDAWVRQSRADLDMLTVHDEDGTFPYAGVPWFAAPFGRDALVTALETLWCDPALARGVLLFLAAHQADRDDAESDAEPGKILHEMRGGEMAACGEIPFARYYGSVDATPLFVWLAARYHRRTADDATLRRLWPHVERALAWMDGPGDPDGDGFLEYGRRSREGLVNQGWKDSRDSVMHADGALAQGPIALCEVQAYAWAARAELADVARALGEPERAAALAAQAERLRARFAERFWCEDLGTYALALDGAKQPCRVRSSNAAHALWTGIAAPEHAAVLGRTLLGDDHFSGWGIRTLASGTARYNPMSYHDGSVWPHDSAIAAAGLARSGATAGAHAIFGSLFDASRAFELPRLPELFCGFARTPGEAPTLYPVACSPQAWAAGAVFLLLEAALGLGVDARRREVRLTRPSLPPFLLELEVRDLRVGEATLDLRVERDGAGAHAAVTSRSGDVHLVVTS
ncbi:MAG: amylo-alpha-1,6-glucosidase [Proteobacteria bacterium]|nr:MAG: amylo-alpha-1,6-glucosidase [Pseudomonadota bacterium]